MVLNDECHGWREVLLWKPDASWSSHLLPTPGFGQCLHTCQCMQCSGPGCMEQLCPKGNGSLQKAVTAPGLMVEHTSAELLSCTCSEKPANKYVLNSAVPTELPVLV